MSLASRFRRIHRALTDAEQAHHEDLHDKAEALAAVIDRLSDGRHKSLALTELEKVVFWATKQLTS